MSTKISQRLEEPRVARIPIARLVPWKKKNHNWKVRFHALLTVKSNGTRWNYDRCHGNKSYCIFEQARSSAPGMTIFWGHAAVKMDDPYSDFITWHVYVYCMHGWCGSPPFFSCSTIFLFRGTDSTWFINMFPASAVSIRWISRNMFLSDRIIRFLFLSTLWHFPPWFALPAGVFFSCYCLDIHLRFINSRATERLDWLQFSSAN